MAVWKQSHFSHIRQIIFFRVDKFRERIEGGNQSIPVLCVIFSRFKFLFSRRRFPGNLYCVKIIGNSFRRSFQHFYILFLYLIVLLHICIVDNAYLVVARASTLYLSFEYRRSKLVKKVITNYRNECQEKVDCFIQP